MRLLQKSAVIRAHDRKAATSTDASLSGGRHVARGDARSVGLEVEGMHLLFRRAAPTRRRHSRNPPPSDWRAASRRTPVTRPRVAWATPWFARENPGGTRRTRREILAPSSARRRPLWCRATHTAGGTASAAQFGAHLIHQGHLPGFIAITGAGAGASSDSDSDSDSGATSSIVVLVVLVVLVG